MIFLSRKHLTCLRIKDNVADTRYSVQKFLLGCAVLQLETVGCTCNISAFRPLICRVLSLPRTALSRIPAVLPCLKRRRVFEVDNYMPRDSLPSVARENAPLGSVPVSDSLLITATNFSHCTKKWLYVSFRGNKLCRMATSPFELKSETSHSVILQSIMTIFARYIYVSAKFYSTITLG